MSQTNTKMPSDRWTSSGKIVKVLRHACKHGTGVNLFHLLDPKMTFDMFEGEFACSDTLKMDISMAETEKGPFTVIDDTDVMFQRPIKEILSMFPDVKIIKLQCVEDYAEPPVKMATHHTQSQPSAFDVMMAKAGASRSVPPKKVSSTGTGTSLNQKDKLYNDVIDLFETKQMKMLNAETEGKYFVQVVTNALWYITNQHDKINAASRRDASVLPIPREFAKFDMYNDVKKKKCKPERIKCETLESHAQTVFSICSKPVMNSNEHWQIGCQMLKNLATCLLNYSSYLRTKCEEIKNNHSLEHPVRQVSENISVRHIPKNVSGVIPPQYQSLDRAARGAQIMEPIFIEEAAHMVQADHDKSVLGLTSLQRYRFFENLQLSVPVDFYKYSPGGSAHTVACIVRVQDGRTEQGTLTQIAATVAKIKPMMPEFHTRTMKRQFKERVGRIANIKSSALDVIYQELATDATSVSSVVRQRMHMVFMGETGIIPDMRELNTGRPTSFDVFFDKMSEVIEEVTAADDRRHNVGHFAQWISLRDLINQTKQRCPGDTKVPSAALVRLQFTPRNAYTHAALNFTSRLPVQYKIQRRQLRISHPDDHYCQAQFNYLKHYAQQYQEEGLLFFCDDKAKVPYGEPGVALSTGVRGKKSIVPTDTTLGAMDHDMQHKGSLTPSVYLQCQIPEDVKKSYVRGKVKVIVNDSVLQMSTPIRHAAAILKQLEQSPKILMKFSDGGTDHRNTLESVKCASIALFKALDLDMYVAARCAPGQSWSNPAERVMSILNLGLQNCTLMRQKLDDETEKTLKRCSGLAQLRTMISESADLKERWTESVEPIQACVANRFRRLVLKDEPIQVVDPVGQDLTRQLEGELTALFPSLDLQNLNKQTTSKVPEYQNWLARHCRQRQYTFQIMKCGDRTCCSEVRSKVELHWLPDPVLDENNEHYKPFHSVFGTETSENCPSKLAAIQLLKPETSTGKSVTDEKNVTILPDDPELLGDAKLYTGQNARLLIDCIECGKPRILYSKFKLSERNKVAVAILKSEFDYSCGSPLTEPKHSLHGKVLVRPTLKCSSPIEKSYYSSEIGRRDICYYCGQCDATVDEDLKKSYKTVFPLCVTCAEAGAKPACMRPYGKAITKKSK